MFQRSHRGVQCILLVFLAFKFLSLAVGNTVFPKTPTLSPRTEPAAECEAVSSPHTRPAMIGPSVLASDLSNLAGESQRVLDDGADYVHLDVMDGHFVPNLTFGAPVIKCLRKNLPRPIILDVHLMVTYPGKWVEDMADAGADVFTFHIEAEGDPASIIQDIKANGMKAGIALKPGTPIEEVLPYINDLDLVLIMTVEPGFGGQTFMHDMMKKVTELRQKYPDLDIEVDGGLGPSTIDFAAKAGANWIVAGSAVYKSQPAHVISVLKRSVEEHGNGKDEANLTPLVPL